MLHNFKRLDVAALSASIVLAAALWVLTIFTFPRNTPAAVLHYSVGVGIDIIGESRQIFMLPIIGSLALIFNTALAWYLARLSKPAYWVLVGITPLVQLVLLTAYMLLWRLN